MHLNMVAIFFLVSASIGGLVWVFIYPILSGDRQAELRRQSVAQQDGGTRKVSSRNAQKSRREQVEATLKSVEERHKKAKTPPLPVRLEQAGLTWSKRAFFIVSAGMGFAAFVLPIFAGVNILVGLALGPLVGLAVPRWLLSFLKKRRERKF